MFRSLPHLWREGLLLTGILLNGAALAAQTVAYPPARRGDVIDDYHGTRVPDPYRWLEDADAPETRVWIEAENRLTAGYLAAIPYREAIRRRLTELWDYPKFGAPFHKGGRYFFFKNDGLQNQAVLYTQSSLTGEPRTLLDPNLLSADGTVALSTLAVAEDGKLVAYGTSASGSDWEEFRVRERGDRPGPARPPALDQVLGRQLDSRRQGILLQPLSGARSRATRCAPSTGFRSCTTTGSAPNRRRTTWSTSNPISPTGESTGPSPTTAVT